MQKSVVFLYNNKEKEIKNAIPFIITSKKNKPLKNKFNQSENPFKIQGPVWKHYHGDYDF